MYDVAGSPLIFDEEFAAVRVAGVFDHHKTSALLAESTHRVMTEDMPGGQRVEEANVHFVRAVCVPEVEGSTQEVAILFCGDRKLRRLSCRRVSFDAGYELYITQIVFQQPLEHFVWMLDVDVV